MKRVATAWACMGLLLVAAAAHAAEMKITNHIPGRYALLVITGAEPNQPLDKDKILAIAREQFEKADVEQFQFAVYNAGKKQGDGFRAMGEMFKANRESLSYLELTGDKAQLQGKFVENVLGYETTPKELHEAYSDNEVVADEDFRGKSVVLGITVPQVAKDAFGKPYIKIGVDEFDFFGAQIYLDKRDPFLRKIKRGSRIVVRGYPRGFVMQSVIIDGVIVSDGESALVDGKAVPKDDISGEN